MSNGQAHFLSPFSTFCHPETALNQIFVLPGTCGAVAVTAGRDQGHRLSGSGEARLALMPASAPGTTSGWATGSNGWLQNRAGVQAARRLLPWFAEHANCI